jgi:hypothetical protein
MGSAPPVTIATGKGGNSGAKGSAVIIEIR